jgi:NitT/TauT family transport system ATP-binding protein
MAIRRFTQVFRECHPENRLEKIIAFERIRKDFVDGRKTLRIVDDLTLEVRRGEVVTLLGPSGCGKSTLLNMTAGLMRPSSGSVRYAGREVAGINRRVGYMTQQDHLLPWRTVAGNVSVPLEIRGVDRATRNARIDELLALVGLTGFGGQYPTKISGGMRKRTALARLLAATPETILMDEPFGALDAQMRINLQSELLRLSGQMGTTVLFVTHDVDEAVALADRCVVLGPRPTSIQRIVNIDLPRPRNLVAIRSNARYQAICADLWGRMAGGFQAASGTPVSAMMDACA